MPGRLNLFQRMMLRWRELHPYNPVHVILIPAPLDRERLRVAIAKRLEAYGLTGLVVDMRRWTFRYQGGPADVPLALVAGEGDAGAALSRQIEQEFNTPFPGAPGAHPFRFFAVEAGEAFHLGVAYDHFLAGGDSIARLVCAIACAYTGAATGSAIQPFELYPPTYRGVFLRHPLWVLRAIFGFPALVASSRRASRPYYADPEDGRNGFKYFRLAPPQMRAVVGTGKAWGVTVNDLLMATVLQAVSPLAESRRRAPRRKEIAVATIVNMRQDFPPAAQSALSPFLAAFRVAHPVPEGSALRSLATDVHAASARIKREHSYLQGILALGLSAVMWPHLPARRRHRLHPKYYPAWAGVTTLNLPAIWENAGKRECAAFDYMRAVPTGPLCPMVFAVTTARDVLHISVSFRTTVFSAAAVDSIVAEFVRCIDRLPVEPVV